MKQVLVAAIMSCIAAIQAGQWECSTQCYRDIGATQCSAFFACYFLPQFENPGNFAAVHALVDGTVIHDWRPNPNPLLDSASAIFSSSATVQCGKQHQFRLIGYPSGATAAVKLDDLGVTVCP